MEKIQETTNMNEQRPYKMTLSLTEKEESRLTEYAQKHKVSRQTIMIQALRMYDAVERGGIALTPTAPSGAGL